MHFCKHDDMTLLALDRRFFLVGCSGQENLKGTVPVQQLIDLAAGKVRSALLRTWPIECFQAARKPFIGLELP